MLSDLARLCLYSVLGGFALFAQSTGTIVGEITDPAGAAIPAARITARSVATGRTTTLQADHAGRYRIPDLPAGDYVVAAQAPGFAPVAQPPLHLRIGATLRADFQLPISTAIQEIQVRGRAESIETDTAERGETFGRRTIDSLPLDGRNYLSLIRLTPTVLPAAAGSNPNNAGGARPDHLAYSVDGVSNMRRRGHEQVALPSLEAIEEVHVSANAYSADQGRMPAAVSVGLRSGTNDFHGSLFEFLRNDAMDARGFFDAATPKLKRNQFGALLAGPIRRQRAFFLASFEALRSTESQTRLARVPTLDERAGRFASAIRDPLSGAVFPNGLIPPDRVHPVARNLLEFLPLPNTTGTFNHAAAASLQEDIEQGLTRLDWYPSQTDQLSLRALFDYREGANPFRGTNLPGFGSRISGQNQIWSAAWNRTFSPRAYNALTAGWARSRLQDTSQNAGRSTAEEVGLPGAAPGSGLTNIAIAGYAAFGDVAALPSNWSDHGLHLHDTFTLIRGAHTLRFGGDWHESRYTEVFGAFGMGQIVFQNAGSGNAFADFLLGLPTQSQRQIGMHDVHMRSRLVGAFLQDDWRIARRITLNLGLRYDITQPPVERDNKWSNFLPELGRPVLAGDPAYPRALLRTRWLDFSPRIGLAVRLSNDARTVLRAGYGVFRGTDLQFTMYQNLGAAAVPFVQLQFFQTTPAARLTLSQPFPAGVPGQNPAASTPGGWEFGNPTPYLQNWNLTLARELPFDIALEAGYVGSKGTHQTAALNLNQAIRTPQGVVRPYPAYGRIIWIGGMGDSSYHALVIAARRQFRSGLLFRSAFTWSKAIDELSFGSAQRQPQNSRDLASERGLADFHRGRAWSSSLVYELPLGRSSTGLSRALLRGWQVNGILHLYDGIPFTPTQTGNLQNGEPTRPDRIADGRLENPTPVRWFDPAAFRRVALNEFRYGNSGRNILIGPGKVILDASLTKGVALTERWRLEFRAEAFNLPNRTNFGNPATAVDQPTAGTIASADPGRVLQLGLKILF